MSRFYMPRVQWFNGNGNPLVNGQLTFFAAGTDTPLDVWTTGDMDVAHLQPVTADSDGKWPAIFLTNGVAYKVVLKNSAGSTIFTEDDVVEGLTLSQMQGVETNADIEDTRSGGATYIRTAGDVAVGDHGAALWKLVTAEPDHDGKKQSDDGYWYEHADPVVIPPQFGNDANLSAKIAFALNKPLVVFDGRADFTVTSADADEDTDMSRHAYLMKVMEWQGRCICVGTYARVRIKIEGFYKVAAWNSLGADSPVAGAQVIYRDRTGPVLSICAASYSEITIASINYGAPSGVPPAAKVYSVTIVVTEALPDYVVTGYAIGTRNIAGNNDADALTGGIVVKTISGDRKTITADLICPRTINLVSPTIIYTDTAHMYETMLASRLVVPSGCIGIDTAYGPDLRPGHEGEIIELWTGADHEAYFNFWDGGCGEFENVGLAWNGPRGTAFDQDLIFSRDNGSYYELVNAVACGGGDRVLRTTAMSNCFVNRSCVGGGGTVQTCINSQSGGEYTLTRACVGGAVLNAVSIDQGCHAFISASILASANTGVNLVGTGANVFLGTSKVVCCIRGVYSRIGFIQLGYHSSEPRRINIRGCDTALDWEAAGFIHGNPTLTSNTADAIGPANTEFKGGVWHFLHDRYIPGGVVEASESVNVSRNQGQLVNILDDQKARFPLQRAGGRVMVAMSGFLDFWSNFYVDVTPPSLIADTNAANAVMDASTVPFNMGALPINSGKFTYRVVDDAGAKYLEILNETGGLKSTWVVAGAPGDLGIGQAIPDPLP